MGLFKSTLGDIAARGLSRRSLLRAGLVTASGLALTALAGCGEEKETAPAVTAAATTAAAMPAATTAAAAPAATAGKVVVWMTDFNEDTQKYYDAVLMPEFKAAFPNITMDVQWPGWDDFTTKLTTAFAAGTSPDVYQPGSDFVASLVYHDQVKPLDEFVARWSDRDDVVASTWDKYWGKYYHLPYLASVDAIIYRKDFFKEAGLDPEKRTYTWEEFLDAAVKTTVRDGDTIKRAGFDDAVSWRTYRQFFWQAGGNEWAPAGNAITLNNDAGVESLQFYKDLYDKHKVSIKEGVAVPTQGQSAFIANLAAMHRTHLGGAADMEKYNPEGWANTGIAEPLKHKAQFGQIDVDVLSMSSQTKQGDAAWEFMTYAMRPNHLLEYNKTQGFLPTRHANASDPYMTGPIQKAYGEILAKFGHTYRSDVGMSKLVQDEIDNAVYGKKEIKQALADADKNVNDLFKDIKFPTG